MNTLGCVYKFTCNDNCKEGIYYGETIRKLSNRTAEHYRTGPIHDHITRCEVYKSELIQTLGDTPAPKDKKQFFNSKFDIVQKNLLHYSERVITEGIYVSLFCPKLNDQVKFRHIHIL